MGVLGARKTKFFDSGRRYFAEDKYREAAMQFDSAIRVDSRFAAAHYQLAQTYLQLGSREQAVSARAEKPTISAERRRR